MESLRQLRLLLWKNWLVQRRQPIWTVFELVLPVVLIAILVVIRQTVEVDRRNATIYDPYMVSGSWQDLFIPVDDGRIILGECFHPNVVFYAPDTEGSFGKAVMEVFAKRFSVSPSIQELYNVTGLTVKGLLTEDELVQEITQQFDSLPRCQTTYLGGIVFQDGFSSADLSNVKELKYKIRLSNTARNDLPDMEHEIDQGWDTNMWFPVLQRLGPRSGNKTSGGKPGYWQEGFLTLQRAIDLSIIELIGEKNKADPSLLKKLTASPINLRRYAYPPFINNLFILVAQQNLPLLFVLGFSLSILYIIRNIVAEKETNLKEYMRVMGLNNFVQWVAWFIVNYMKLLIISAILTIFLTVSINDKRILDRMDPSFLFFFLMVFSASVICYCFSVSVFFRAGNTAAACGGIIWCMLYIPYFFMEPRYATLTQAMKISSCLLINTAMAYGGHIIGAYEGLDIGVQWNNIQTPSGVGDYLTMTQVLLMLVIDSGICLLVTWYVEAILPGDYGVPQPWYFPFTKTYWLRGRSGSAYLLDNEEPPSFGAANEAPREDSGRAKIDCDSSGIRPQILLKSLTKIYGSGRSKKLAVENLDLSIYSGQITALLGHNGAGKSTTMAMLTGMLPPTSGSIKICGYDISRHLPVARKYLGLCPQHNVLFDNLTVMEHLTFYCELKGRRLKMGEVNYLLSALDMEQKRNEFSKNLSGGMKRKLSLAIALIGGSEVVMLDEPTSGVDAGSRHEIWHVLQKEKHRRTILFTTHYMEEADALSDRIAIIAHGRLQCYGSGLFLKKTYGAGYNMTAIFKHNDAAVIRRNSEEMVSRIQDYVPEAKLQSCIGSESMFVLPSERRKRFPHLFAELEKEQNRFGVVSFVLSVTTMEEVFLRVTEKADAEFYANSENSPESFPKTVSDTPLLVNYRNRGLPLLYQHFKAMILKRLLHSLRNWLVLMVQLLIPVFVTTLTMIVNNALPGPINMPAMALDTDTYGHTIVPVFNSIIDPEGAEGQFLTHLSDAYKNQIKNQNVRVLPNGDMTTYVMDEIGRVGKANFDLNNIFAATFSEGRVQWDNNVTNLSVVTAYFNNQAYHSPGITANIMDNAMLQLALANTSQQLKLTVVNHPLPPTTADQRQSWVATGVVQFNIAFNLVFAMAFLVSSFIVFLVKERVSKAKHLQLLGGIHPLTFWLATWLTDFFNYMLTVVAIMIVFFCFDAQPLIGREHWLNILLLFITYGWACLPMIYVTSFLFESPAAAFVKLTIYNIFTGQTTVSLVGILRQPLRLYDLADKMNWVFMVMFPSYNLGQGLITYYQNVYVVGACKPVVPYCAVTSGNWLCCGHDKFTTNYITWSSKNGLGRFLVFLVLNGVFYFWWLTLVELGYVRRFRRLLRYGFARRHTVNLQSVTGSTMLENGTINNAETKFGSSESDEENSGGAQKPEDWRWKSDATHQVLVAEALEKRYGTFLAVDKLSFSLKPGECFGLLGVNGAGKTSTFQMLTGESEIDNGDAYVNGVSIRKSWRKAGMAVGYCPQFSAVIDQMTGAEMLAMFARIRGIQESLIDWVVRHSLTTVGIEEYANKLINTYSGGTKRKLSLAIGLIGNPAVLMLDEPTSGVDPASRRVIWEVLANVKRKGIAVLLTSHSMDECEALCGRLAIMVAGRFKCLGSPQYLKAKYGSGHTLLVKVKEEKRISPLATALQRRFPGTILKETHCRQSSYRIPVSGNTWSSLFGVLEDMVPRYGIVDYSLSQTTLEEIFLTFAQQDRQSKRERKGDLVNGDGSYTSDE